MRLEDDDIDEHAATVVCLLLRQLATGTDLQLQHLDSRLFRLVASVAQGRTIDKSEIRYDEHGVANRLPVTVYFGDRAAIVAACGNPCGVGQYTLESSRGVRVGFSRRGAIPLADGDSDPQLSSDMADEWDDWIAGLDPVDRARALADCGNYRGSLLRV